MGCAPSRFDLMPFGFVASDHGESSFTSRMDLEAVVSLIP